MKTRKIETNRATTALCVRIVVLFTSIYDLIVISTRPEISLASSITINKTLFDLIRASLALHDLKQ